MAEEIVKLTNQVSTLAAAAARSSSSGESRAASRTPRGGRIEPETPCPQQLEFGLPGEKHSFKNSSECGVKDSLSECDNRLYPCMEGDVTSSGEKDKLENFLAEYDIRLLPCKEGDVTSSGEQDSLKFSLQHVK